MSDETTTTGSSALTTPPADSPANPSADTPLAASDGDSTGGSSSYDFMAGLSEENRGYVEKKDWKSANSMADSYRHLEKLAGGGPDKLIKVPSDPENQEEMDGVYSKLGWPGEAGKYDFQEAVLGEEASDADKALAGSFAEIANEARLSNRQAKIVAEKWLEKTGELTRDQAAAAEQQGEEQIKALEGSWKDDFKKNVAVATRARRALDIPDEVMDGLDRGLGVDGALKLLHSIGEALGEDSFRDGEPGGSDARSAHEELEDLKRDNDFRRALAKGESWAVKKRDKLVARTMR